MALLLKPKGLLKLAMLVALLRKPKDHRDAYLVDRAIIVYASVAGSHLIIDRAITDRAIKSGATAIDRAIIDKAMIDRTMIDRAVLPMRPMGMSCHRNP